MIFNVMAEFERKLKFERNLKFKNIFYKHQITEAAEVKNLPHHC